MLVVRPVSLPRETLLNRAVFASPLGNWLRGGNPFTSTVVPEPRDAVEIFFGQARRRGYGCGRRLLPFPLTERQRRSGILGGHHRNPRCGVGSLLLHLCLLRRHFGLYLLFHLCLLRRHGGLHLLFHLCLLRHHGGLHLLRHGGLHRPRLLCHAGLPLLCLGGLHCPA